MVKVSLEDLKKLRAETSAGISHCKIALTKAAGDYEGAKSILKEMGHALAAKKADRQALDGVVGAKVRDNFAVILELNCETDFVARNEKFQQYAQRLLDLACLHKPSTKEELLRLEIEGYPCVAEMIVDMVATFKENIVLSRYSHKSLQGSGIVGLYIHKKYTEGLGRYGVLCAIESDIQKDKMQDIAKSICIQIMSGAPIAVSQDKLDQSVVEAKKTEYQDSIKGKPQNIAEKIISGKLQKFYKECVLLEQEFYADSEKSVKEYLQDKEKELGGYIKVLSYTAFTLGNQNA